MKRLPLVITAALLLLVSPFSKAQEQRGIVKTRGRMVNGKLVHGEGIPGTQYHQSAKQRRFVLLSPQ